MTGTDGLSGEVGRARYDFGGDIAPEDLKGDLGRVRELFDLGERTCEGTILRDAVLVARLFAVTGPWAAVMVVLARFLGIIRSWSVCVFSLSEAISLLDRLVPRRRAGLVNSDAGLCAIAGLAASATWCLEATGATGLVGLACSEYLFIKSMILVVRRA